MRLEELKKGFWGYQKDSVFQYITDLESACSQRLQEKDLQAERAAREAQTRVQALEEENRALRAELSRLREQQDQISQAILDARASAEAMRAQTQAQEEAAREALRQALERETGELNRYRERVAALRENIRRTLEALDRQAESLEQQAQAAEEAAPDLAPRA